MIDYLRNISLTARNCLPQLIFKPRQSRTSTLYRRNLSCLTQLFIRSNSNTSDSTNSNETEKPKTLECTICFEEVGEGQFTGLDACRHYFCNDCWKMNLTDVQIREGHTLDITCMHMNCKNLVPAEVVQ